MDWPQRRIMAPKAPFLKGSYKIAPYYKALVLLKQNLQIVFDSISPPPPQVRPIPQPLNPSFTFVLGSHTQQFTTTGKEGGTSKGKLTFCILLHVQNLIQSDLVARNWYKIIVMFHQFTVFIIWVCNYIVIIQKLNGIDFFIRQNCREHLLRKRIGCG